LAAEEGGARTHVLPSKGAIEIGRSPDVEVTIDDASISRVHARMHLGAELQIEDLNSSNGTFVQGQRIEPGRKVNLRSGDFFEIGEVVCAIRGRAAEVVDDSEELVISDGKMRELHQLVDKVARGGVNVLLLGETGVGKEIFAQRLHAASPRADKPFLTLNCAAFSANLLESELFGHERGAFTGADRRKVGLLESANGGMVFLDEVGELEIGMQAKLLRVLEAGTIRRVGGVDSISIDVVYVAATNRDLQKRIEEEQFRSDLFFRLNGFSINIPPLRDRRDEVMPLARRFASGAARRMGEVAAPEFSAAAVSLLEGYQWPGNIRELRNLVDRAVLVAGGCAIDTEHLPIDASDAPSRDFVQEAVAQNAEQSEAPDDLSPEELEERKRMIAALAECYGNQTKAAAQLGISRRWLSTKMSRFNIPRARKR
jgi:transcriptional regulator with GAF, ATPase, and Fis domain